MSVSAAPAATRRELSGWGRTSAVTSTVMRPHATDEVAAAVGVSGDGVIARGCGRSYGDAAQNRDGAVVEMTALHAVLDFDEIGGKLTAQAGATVRQLQRLLTPRGWSLPVVPGTQDVTLGGAIASDVHGKNHVRDGGFGDHVVSLTLRTADGAAHELSAEGAGDAYRATVGGMGLTGVIESATLRLNRVSGPALAVDTARTRDLDETLATLVEFDGRRRYTVAWIDALGGAGARGRGVVTGADHAHAGSQAPTRVEVASRVSAPSALAPLLRPASVRAFNELKWRLAPRARRDEIASLAQHFFPLDALRAWNRLYGPHGLLQYQFVVPPQADAVLREALERLRAARVPVYLAVLKRLGAGAGGGGMLSFPIDGWTLALDVPAAASTARATLDGLDELVAQAGGRVYLTKDARLRRDCLAAMYPQLDDWRQARAALDPRGVMRSDLGTRLGLTAVSVGATA
jgi:decaprenylphospho-beta-D-ribofuranose 2-oxidase